MQTLFSISLEAGSKTLAFYLQTDCVAGDSCPSHLHHGYPPMGLLPLPFAALVTGSSFSWFQYPYGTNPVCKCIWVFRLSVSPGV